MPPELQVGAQQVQQRVLRQVHRDDRRLRGRRRAAVSRQPPPAAAAAAAAAAAPQCSRHTSRDSDVTPD